MTERCQFCEGDHHAETCELLRREHANTKQRWVCRVCGRVTEPGGSQFDLRDTSCVVHAVLCWAVKRRGKWVPVDQESKQP